MSKFNTLYHPFTVITCPEVLPPVNGLVTQLGNTPGDLAIYSCIGIFEPSGETLRRCGPDGQWEGEAPRCEGEEMVQCMPAYCHGNLYCPYTSTHTRLSFSGTP